MCDLRKQLNLVLSAVDINPTIEMKDTALEVIAILVTTNCNQGDECSLKVPILAEAAPVAQEIMPLPVQ